MSESLIIARSRDELLYDQDGVAYTDLCMGYGSVWLGHANEAVRTAVCAQLAEHASPGYLASAAANRAYAALAGFLPASHHVAGLYSTGMEAMEFALRVCCAHTGRADIAGFAGSTHGKSFVTAALGWEPPYQQLPNIHRLPFVRDKTENEILDALRAMLKARPLAAIVVEPVQMSAGGFHASDAFYADVYELARAHGALLVFDEIVTGFYRTGEPFYFSRLPFVPDIVLLGKGMANGLQASAVALRNDIGIDRDTVRPGSTFVNHPVTAAAIQATLAELSALEPKRRVAGLEAVIRDALPAESLRGLGAMWCLQLPTQVEAREFATKLVERNVIVSYYANYVRLLPALTMNTATLAQACRAIREVYDHPDQ